MSVINGSIELFGGTSGTKQYNSPQAMIQGDYKKARVLPSQPPSMWIIYKFDNWDHLHPEDRPDMERPVIVEEGERPMPDNSKILSIQGFNRMNPGIILFEHSQFRGYANLFNSRVNDLTSELTTRGRVTGACSYIITGGVWNLYTNTNCTGPKVQVNSTTELTIGRHDFGRLTVDKQIKSIEFVRA